MTVERVWQVVAAFGGFGFCKAHAAAFAIPVYQSAWLKHHYPAAFFAGVLTHDPGMYPKRVIIADARLSGVHVFPVDVNFSAADWTVASRVDTAPPGATPDSDGPYPPKGEEPNPSSRTGSVNSISRPQSPPSPPARRRLETSGPLQALRGYLPGGHSAPEGNPPGRPQQEEAASPQAIRCSLREIKGISDAEIARIVSGQPYVSLRDFWNRARVSRPVAERLVLIGAFDSLYAAIPADAPNVLMPPSSPSTPRQAPQRSPDIPRFAGVLPPQPPLRPSRRDLLARVGVLARQSPPARTGSVTLDLFTSAGAGAVDAELADGMADLVPAGELRELDQQERVAAELEILGFDVSQHVLTFYDTLLAELGVVRSARLADRENGETILVAGAKVATQTPAVRSGQRIIFASLDDAVGLVDLAFFESVQDRCAARLFGSWLLLVRGRVRRAGAGPMAVTVNGTECWDLPALEEIRIASGMTAVRAAMAAGDVGPGAHLTGPSDQGQASRSGQASRTGSGSIGRSGQAGRSGSGSDGRTGRPVPVPAAQAAAAAADGDPGAPARPVVFGNGFVLSPYAETGSPGGSIKRPPRTLWHASPGSTATPD